MSLRASSSSRGYGRSNSFCNLCILSDILPGHMMSDVVNILGSLVGPLLYGWLSDRIGSRNLFLMSTALFLVASAACATKTEATARCNVEPSRLKE